MNNLEHTLQLLYNPITDVAICGDINLNYLDETISVKQLKVLCETFNLISIINFPTRIGASTSTAIDNIFIDITKYDYHTVSSLHNGLSDHEAQLLTIVPPLKNKNESQTYSYRKIDKYTAAEFMLQLSYESLDEIF
jgi:hypothetical protein